MRREQANNPHQGMKAYHVRGEREAVEIFRPEKINHLGLLELLTPANTEWEWIKVVVKIEQLNMNSQQLGIVCPSLTSGTPTEAYPAGAQR